MMGSGARYADAPVLYSFFFFFPLILFLCLLHFFLLFFFLVLEVSILRGLVPWTLLGLGLGYAIRLGFWIRVPIGLFFVRIGVSAGVTR